VADEINIEEIARKYALQNAVQYGGKAQDGKVIAKVLAEKPELRRMAKEIIQSIKEVVSKVNSMSVEEQKKELETKWPELLEKHVKAKRVGLPELKNVTGKVVMRFAPGPSGPLHIGHTRAAILNDEYTKMYNGKLILRIEDTDPERVHPKAYEMIPEDLTWLGVNWHETVIQSDRFELYYDYAEKLIKMGHAYVCDCKVEDWRALKIKKMPCPHRARPPEEQIERFKMMFDGTYKAGQASVVIKTNIEDPNPALRDWVALRIVEHPHPRTGTKYRVYPLMNFSVAIDDHELGMTHTLRGKDHLNNTYRQYYIFDYFGWERPEYIHYGRVKIIGTELSKRKIDEGVKSGKYTGYDDPRLGTLKALAKRGISPEAIRKYWVAAGTKEVDLEFSWKTLYAFDTEIQDPNAKRYFFVWEPKEISIEGISHIESHAPYHPMQPRLGNRVIKLDAKEGRIKLLITSEDYAQLSNGTKVRLKDLCNIEYLGDGHAKYIGNDLSIIKSGAKIIHWVPIDGIKTKVRLPDGDVISGISEPLVLNEHDKVVQFERFGFTRVEKTDNEITAYYSHGGWYDQRIERKKCEGDTGESIEDEEELD